MPEPISVRPRPDGTFGVFKGRRRAQASAIGAATVVQAAGRGTACLHLRLRLRLRDATGCAHADGDAPETPSPWGCLRVGVEVIQAPDLRRRAAVVRSSGPARGQRGWRAWREWRGG
ncbi:hypothetical protein [Streptomyces sp. NPDC058739]|uniref:hypothetical protein n=1 Tax=Streptomyces sp. NPDC058739 TaxID=3346618 RepID=UPI00369EA90B